MSILRRRIKVTPRFARLVVSSTLPRKDIPPARELPATVWLFAVALRDMLLRIRPADDVEVVIVRLRIEEEDVVDRTEALPRSVRAGPSPNDLVAELWR